MTEIPPAPEPEIHGPSLPPPAAADVAPPPRRPKRFPYGVAAIIVLVVAGGITARWWLPSMQRLLGRHEPVAEMRAPEPPPPVEARRVVPAPEPAAPTTDPALLARIDRLEQALGDMAAGSGGTKGDIAALRRQVDALGQRTDTVEQKPDADPQKLADVSDALKRVTQRLAALEAKSAEQDAVARNDRSIVLAAAELSDALAGSRPFDAPLALLQAGNDPAMVEPIAILQRHAKTGVASRVLLADGLAEMPARLSQPVPALEDAGFWERVERRMSGLVTVRRIDEAPDPKTGKKGSDQIIAEAEKDLRGGDLDAAVATMRQLDGTAAEAAKPWLDAATARLEAEQAARAVEAAATRRLSQQDGDRQ